MIVFALQLVHGPVPSFLYDAAQYWGGSLALASGGDAVVAGVLEMRGALSTTIYLVPALASSMLPPLSAPWAVLVWNAALMSVLCVSLLPRISTLLRPGAMVSRVWLSAVVVGTLLSGFARYPLLDLWSAAFALLGTYVLLRGTRWWSIVLGALSMAIAINLRPAYLVPLAVAAMIVAVTKPRAILWGSLGLVVGAVPQLILNAVAFRQFSLNPIATPTLVNVQSRQAAFAIRYDTVLLPDRFPQQWFCDPDYARQLIDDAPPQNPIGVAASVLAHLPDSLWFLTQKAAASLQWSFATPMERNPGGTPSALAVGVVLVSVGGLMSLLWFGLTASSTRTERVATVVFAAMWLGTVATLMMSTPETRFALPLVVIGTIGLLTALPLRGFSVRRPWSTAAAGLLAVALAAVVFAAGLVGVSHALPPGPLESAAMCVAAER